MRVNLESLKGLHLGHLDDRVSVRNRASPESVDPDSDWYIWSRDWQSVERAHNCAMGIIAVGSRNPHVGLSEDIDTVVERLGRELDTRARARLEQLGSRLKELALRRVVSSNHTVMELIVASHLLSKGFEVDVEHVLAPDLVCDVYASLNGESLVVEVETGFVPPENSTDPVAYRLARELSKVARYSAYSDYFAMAVPPFHVLQLPYIIFLPPEERARWGIEYFKRLIDVYYKKPPVKLEELLMAKLHYVYVVLVDALKLIELTAREYFVIFVERPAALLWRAGWPLSELPVGGASAELTDLMLRASNGNLRWEDQMRRPLSPLKPGYESSLMLAGFRDL